MSLRRRDGMRLKHRQFDSIISQFMWEPISLTELLEVISETEKELEDVLFKFWQLIKIKPEKWLDEAY